MRRGRVMLDRWDQGRLIGDKARNCLGRQKKSDDGACLMDTHLGREARARSHQHAGRASTVQDESNVGCEEKMNTDHHMY